MESYTTSKTLHTGLITLDKRKFISPNHEWPQLFTDTLEPDYSVESQARLALGTRGIRASSEMFLSPHPRKRDRGYLLRESAQVDVEANNFAVYSPEDLREFVESHDTEDVRVHFLRQIVKHLAIRR